MTPLRLEPFFSRGNLIGRKEGNVIVCVVIRNLISLSTPVLAGYDFFARGQNRIK